MVENMFSSRCKYLAKIFLDEKLWATHKSRCLAWFQGGITVVFYFILLWSINIIISYEWTSWNIQRKAGRCLQAPAQRKGHRRWLLLVRSSNWQVRNICLFWASGLHLVLRYSLDSHWIMFILTCLLFSFASLRNLYLLLYTYGCFFLSKTTYGCFFFLENYIWLLHKTPSLKS